MTYEGFVSLLQNEDRIRTRQSASMLKAIQAAGSDSELGDEWGDALAWDASAAAEAVSEANRVRAMNRARRSRRR